MIDTLDRRRARYDPARQDHLIKISQIRRADKLVKPQLDARQLDHPAVVAQRFVELLFAGDLFGDIKLPANLSQRIKQRHAVPARGGIDRKRQACRASTHDGQAFFIDRRNDRHFGFMAGARVDEAGGDLPDEDLIQTGLITADAGVDLIRAAALRFGEQLGIGQERARHRDHVGIAARNHIVRHLRIVNAVGGDQRNGHFAFQPARYPAERRARHRRGDGRDARLVPADAGVDNRGARGFYRLRQLHGFVKRPAALHQVEHRQAEDDDKVRTRTFTYRAHHLHGKAHPAGIVAAPFVVALVGAGGEELVNQVAFGAHHLNAVIARFTRQRGAAGEVVNQRQDLVVAQSMRSEAVNRRLNGRWRNQIRLVAVASGVQNLQGNFTALVVYRVGHNAVMRQLCCIVQHRTALHADAGRGRGHAAGDNQRHPVARALGIESCQTLGPVRMLLEPGVHRAHQHAVFECGEPQIERGE